MDLKVNRHFLEFIGCLKYDFYFLIGGFGSSKSFNTTIKIVLLCIREKRSILCFRKIGKSVERSIFKDICNAIELLGLQNYCRIYRSKPNKIVFKNGSEILFDGLDDVQSQKSIPGISVIWIEEANQITLNDFKVLNKRLRTVDKSCHFILTTNPGEKADWTFKLLTEELGVDEFELYEKKIITKNINKANWYIHHSDYTHNKFLNDFQIRMLEGEKDDFMKTVGTKGHFGSIGESIFNKIIVLPHAQMLEEIEMRNLNIYVAGLDLGYSVSYNALTKNCVDDVREDLFILQEDYMNNVGDAEFYKFSRMQQLTDEGITIYCDHEPQSINYFNNLGISIIKAKKGNGSILSNLRKLQRFNTIYISEECPNCIREFTSLKRKLDDNGIPIVSSDKKKMFGFDPHAVDSVSYSLSYYNQTSLKENLKIQKEVDYDD